MFDWYVELVEEVGILVENIFIIVKGDVFFYEDGKFYLGDWVEVGNMMIDGIGVGDIGNIVLCDWWVFFEDGIFVVVVMIDCKKKKIVVCL